MVASSLAVLTLLISVLILRNCLEDGGVSPERREEPGPGPGTEPEVVLEELLLVEEGKGKGEVKILLEREGEKESKEGVWGGGRG